LLELVGVGQIGVGLFGGLLVFDGMGVDEGVERRLGG
jgi:hypothetical protein